MPSAEMRGNTRIFEARVLRSGRRVSTGSRNQKKHMKSKEVSEWIDLLDDSGDDGDDAKYQSKGWHKNDGVRRHKDNPMDIDKKSECKLEAMLHENLIVDRDSAKMFGIFYTRKRKKLNSNIASVSFVGGETNGSVDKRYQKHFVRQRWRKKIKLSCDSNIALITRETQFNAFRKALVIVVKPWSSNKYFVSDVLTAALRYMRRARIELDQLMGFFLSKTFNNVCSSCGIDFMQVIGSSLPNRGLCIISETSFIPMFYIDFSAVPSCFMYLHSCIQLQFATISLNIKDESFLEETDDTDDMITKTVCNPEEKDQVTDISVPIVTNFIQPPPVLESRPETRAAAAAAAKFSGLTMQLRNARKKTTNSLRQKKKRKPPVFRVNSKSPDRRRSSIQFTPRYRSRSVAKRNIRSSVSQVKSAAVGSNRTVDPTSCVANILITEPDKCYREEGVVITLEVSTGNRCHLAIKKNGVLQYSLVAQNIMKPCTCNRFTRAIILNIENGWKLEFTERLQWSVFKELYKKCSDRNIQVPLESSIPIPGVTEVPIDLNNNSYFVRPVSYINVKNDELTRALTSKVSNYDMDSDDEEWLKKFNADNVSEVESFNLLSDEDFELIIDAFERGSHFNPDDYNDENTVPSISVNVVPRIVEAVYVYWFKKRKQKKSALVRVFQLYQPRKSQFIPSSVLRKKRSFKRQRVLPGQRFLTGRGKPPTLLEAMAVEQVAAREREERRNAVLRVEETKAAAKRSESVAVVKRQRAQHLMENADLATYKAVMALRIAELAQIAAESAASAAAVDDSS